MFVLLLQGGPIVRSELVMTEGK